MITFSIYFLILCFLIYRTSLFGLFKDEILNPKFYLFAFLIKCLGIGVFYFVYYWFYGSLDYADTGNFMHDTRIIHDISKWNFGEFIKVIFGFQDESEGTELYKKFIVNTKIWNKNPDEFFYNDNRIIIRFHALLSFISFKNYFVHALFTCLLSLVGINWIYRSFKFLFKGKETLLFLVWLCFPGTLFWTSGVLKEGLAIFLIGLTLIALKRLLIDQLFSFKNIAMLSVGVFMSFLFKQYVTLPLLILSSLFFLIARFNLRKPGLIYCIVLFSLFIIGNESLRLTKGRSLLEIMANRQHVFLDMSKGGIFLFDSVKFVRLPYDHSLVKVDSSQALFSVTIKKGAPYMYWEHTHQQDTLYNGYNTDTTSVYKFEYEVGPANSTLSPPVMNGSYLSFVRAIPYALYVSLCKPLFFDARNKFDYLASLENLIILFSLGMIAIKWKKVQMHKDWHIYFLSIAFSILIIIGITSPNIGAIERYRCLVLPFIMMVTLLCLNVNGSHKTLNLFRYRSAE